MQSNFRSVGLGRIHLAYDINGKGEINMAKQKGTLDTSIDISKGLDKNDDTCDVIVTIIKNDEFDSDIHRGYLEQNHAYALLEDACLPIRIYDPKDIEYSEKYAYVHNGFFYLYRGNCLRSIKKGPGIFLDPESNQFYLIEVDPSNPRDVAKYRVCQEHMAVFDKETVLDDIKKNGEEMYSSGKVISKSFQPNLKNTDDSLKRVMKMAMMEKNIDIDQYRDRFSDKNATFNFKQVIKNDAKLSMLLFERGCDAFGLKYTIIVEEAFPDNPPVGKKLEHKIIVSSDDTYEL